MVEIIERVRNISRTQGNCFFIFFSLYNLLEKLSAFEHVFVGETGRGKISGFHNWLQFYRLESRGLIDYRGFYVRPILEF